MFITSPEHMSSGSFNWKHTITFHAGVAQDADKALELYDGACKDGSMGGCNNAGLVMQNRNPPNLDEAVKYFQKACDGGLKNGCFNMSGLYLQVHCRQWRILMPILHRSSFLDSTHHPDKSAYKSLKVVQKWYPWMQAINESSVNIPFIGPLNITHTNAKSGTFSFY